MSNAAVWTGEMPGGPVDGIKPLLARGTILLSAICLLAGLALSVWMYFEETRSIFNQPGTENPGNGDRGVVLKHLDRSVVFILLPGVIGTLGFAAAMSAGLVLSSRSWRDKLKTKEDEWRKTTTTLQILLQESRKNESESRRIQSETLTESGKVGQANTQLRAELDQLKKAEKSLSQRRQELESTKAVLELHVQERTRELQKLQRRYEMILNSAGEGICGLDMDGKATFVNPAVARITGWSVTELLGKTEEEIFGRNGEAPAGEEQRQFGERMFLRRDGSCLPVEYVKTPIEEGGKAVGSVVVFKDIAERKRVEEAISQKAAELARSNAELEQFAFVASHDLQEPLRKIQAFGDRLKTRVEGAIAPEARDYLDRMQGAAERMRTLISDLLTFSRVLRRTEAFVSVDLFAVIKAMLGDLEVRIEKTGAKVEVAELPTVDGDPVQMHQLFLNLVGNALKFQPAGRPPMVKISSRRFNNPAGEDFCEISVQDNGIGFDEKYMDKIFAVFQRLHGRNEYEGTGVGLAVCRRITDRHHGTITAKSQLGQGATFIVTLPLRQANQKA